jgi:hypothetical protein
MSIDQDINQFCDYFEQQVQQINTIQPEEQNDYGASQIRLYKKTLYVTSIDTLAGFRFSKNDYRELNKRNKARFTRFIQEYCNWENGSLISLPFLLDQLTTKKLKDSNLFASVEERLKGFSGEDGGTTNIETIDLSLGEVLEMAHSEKEESLIYSSQHYSLFYGYRNCLVHEAREPGKAMEVTQNPAPHYHSYIQEKPQEITQWHLVYPVEHFRSILSAGIANSREYFFKATVNPYDNLSGTRWW